MKIPLGGLDAPAPAMGEGSLLLVFDPALAAFLSLLLWPFLAFVFSGNPPLPPPPAPIDIDVGLPV